MKRIIIPVLILVAVAAVAVAQMPPREMPSREIIDRAANFVGLTADQRAQWEAMHKELAASLQPLFDQRRTAHHNLESLLEATPADACAIGNAAIAAHSVDAQLKAAHDAFKAKAESILTPEQKTKLEAFIAAEHPMEGPHPHPH